MSETGDGKRPAQGPTEHLRRPPCDVALRERGGQEDSCVSARSNSRTRARTTWRVDAQTSARDSLARSQLLIWITPPVRILPSDLLSEVSNGRRRHPYTPRGVQATVMGSIHRRNQSGFCVLLDICHHRSVMKPNTKPFERYTRTTFVLAAFSHQIPAALRMSSLSSTFCFPPYRTGSSLPERRSCNRSLIDDIAFTPS